MCYKDFISCDELKTMVFESLLEDLKSTTIIIVRHPW